MQEILSLFCSLCSYLHLQLVILVLWKVKNMSDFLGAPGKRVALCGAKGSDLWVRWSESELEICHQQLNDQGLGHLTSLGL